GGGRLGRLAAAYRRLVLADQAAFVARAAAAAAPGARPRILEVGCGAGVLLGLLAARGFTVQGLDLSERAAAIARRGGVAAAAGTVASAGLAEGSFDIVVMQHVLEHAPDPRGLLGRVRRLLAP